MCFVSFDWKAKVARHFGHLKDEEGDISSLGAGVGDEPADAPMLLSRKLVPEDSCKEGGWEGEEETEHWEFGSESGARAGEDSSPDDVEVTPADAVDA